MAAKKKFDEPRFKVEVDGKWTGGSFASRVEADAAAKKCGGKVVPKGAKSAEEKK